MKLNKGILRLIVLGVISMSLVGCSSPEEGEKASGSDQTKQEQQNKENKGKANKGINYTVEGAISEDAGITQTIREVSVFDNMLDAVKSYGQNEIVVDDENKDKVTVVIKFEIKNSNEFKVCTYPSQATIVTNNGEQKDADILASESFDGDIFEGVTQEGHILFNLDKTTAEDLSSFKMAWNTSHDNGTEDNYDDDYYKENKVEVKLK